MEPSDQVVGNDGTAATAGDGVAAPAQNSLTAIAEQSTSGSWRAYTAPLAPWIIQGLWLLHIAAAIGWVRVSDLGFAGIVYVVAIAYALLAWLAWSLAWTLLARQSIGHRLGYLLASAAALLIAGDLMFAWRDNQERQLLSFSARVAGGLAIALGLAVWRGWRIRWAAHASMHEQPGGRSGQFSIGDLLLLTAAAAAFLGLMSARQNFSLREHWDEISAECLIIVCGAAIPLVGLRLRRFRSALLACSLIALVILLVAIAILERQMFQAMFRNPSELLFISVAFGPALAGLLISIGLARWWGYRLVPGGAGFVTKAADDGRSVGRCP